MRPRLMEIWESQGKTIIKKYQMKIQKISNDQKKSKKSKS